MIALWGGCVRSCGLRGKDALDQAQRSAILFRGALKLLAGCAQKVQEIYRFVPLDSL
jgi:hypothetical protein